MIRVLLADDQALIRSGIRALLDAEDDIEVVAEAADGKQAVTLATQHRPDIALVDIQMPVVDGIEATRQITGRDGGSATRVLILTTFDLDEYVYAALHAGASGFLLKSTQPAELVSAIRVIAAGDALLAPSVTRRLVEEFTRRPVPQARQAAPDPAPVRAPTAGLAGITGREREVLALIATGLSNSEIAARLYISEATAKTHVGHLLTKLNARDRVHLVILAFQVGLVSAATAGPGGWPRWNPPAA